MEHGPSPRAATIRLVAMIVALAVTGCGSDAPKLESPSTPGIQIDLRYDPIDSEYCAEARLAEVLAGFDLEAPASVSFPENFESAPANDPPSWIANCEVGADDSRINLGYYATLGNVIVHVYGRPQSLDDYAASPPSAVAQLSYDHEKAVAIDLVSANSGTQSPTTASVDGWWDEGISVAATREGINSPDYRVVDLAYVVYDDNLLMRVMLRAEYEQDAEEQAIRFTRSIAVAFTERAVDRVPLASSD